MNTSDLQVEVYINGIISKCSGDCGFEWSEDSTPVVTGISPSQGVLTLSFTESLQTFSEEKHEASCYMLNGSDGGEFRLCI